MYVCVCERVRNIYFARGVGGGVVLPILNESGHRKTLVMLLRLVIFVISRLVIEM